MMVDGSLMVLKGWAWAVLLTDYLHSPSSVVDFYLTALPSLLQLVQKILIVVTAMCPNQSAKKQLRDFSTTYDYLKVYLSLQYSMFFKEFLKMVRWRLHVFENHRKSLIQHCERSELRLHFEWTKVDKKCQKWSILSSFWNPEACDQTVLPDRSVLIGQKLVENVKIQMRHFRWFSNNVRLWDFSFQFFALFINRNKILFL